MNPEDLLSDEQAAKLANFALTQVTHLLLNPLPAGPSQLEIALQDAFKALCDDEEGSGARYRALTTLALAQNPTNATAREAALQARLALAHEAANAAPKGDHSAIMNAADTARRAARKAQEDFIKSL